MDALLLLMLLSVLANSVWLARIGYRLTVVEHALGIDGEENDQ